ncbi:MAG TPA: hypothetical protein VGR96_16320 [Acidobacteriaceae bacterium]|nr:hypothetical protein [Acidobacteriaceae bacterium]
MYTRLDKAHRALPVALGVLTLLGVGALFAWDIHSAFFSAGMHAALEASSLALIALAYLVYQSAHRPPLKEWIKAIMLVAAFLFWAANQVWPKAHQALVFNDVAIGLFILDVFLVMVGWPKTSPDESFAESPAERPAASHSTIQRTEG